MKTWPIVLGFSISLVLSILLVRYSRKLGRYLKVRRVNKARAEKGMPLVYKDKDGYLVDPMYKPPTDDDDDDEEMEMPKKMKRK